VLYAFVDESERDESFYFLGALICTQAQIDALTSALDGVIALYAHENSELTPATEFHASAMMRASDPPWRRTPMRVRFALFHQALNEIEKSGARMYIEGIDIASQLSRGYPNPTPARELAFSHLFERINDCARDAGTQVQVFADDHHTAETSRSNFTRYQRIGTYGYRSSLLESIEPDIRFISSDTSRPLQAADLVTYLYNRRMTIVDSDRRAAEKKILMWRSIEPALLYPRGRARIWP
jgi:hypothetical protein